jgi:predicted nucleotide-binding protein
VTLQELCQLLAQTNLSNAKRAATILLWEREQDSRKELSAIDLAKILRDHDLGNPKPKLLERAIKKLRVTLPGANDGFRLRADSVSKIAKWTGHVSSPARTTESSEHALVPVQNVVPQKRPERSTTTRLLPSLFIGSSVEGIDVGRAIHTELEHDCEPTLWDKGIFGPNNAPLHDLLAVAARIDFAVIVLTPDDVLEKKGKIFLSARDNCIFELGLFMGALGPKRCFFVHQRGVDIGLPSDLAGVTPLSYPKRSDGNVRAALQTACDNIREAIRKHAPGKAPTKKRAS